MASLIKISFREAVPVSLPASPSPFFNFSPLAVSGEAPVFSRHRLFSRELSVKGIYACHEYVVENYWNDRGFDGFSMMIVRIDGCLIMYRSFQFIFINK